LRIARLPHLLIAIAHCRNPHSGELRNAAVRAHPMNRSIRNRQSAMNFGARECAAYSTHSSARSRPSRLMSTITPGP
jgi:hypothetical protein